MIRRGGQGEALLMEATTKTCLARSLEADANAGGQTAVSVVACDPTSAEQVWDIGAANVTVAQVKPRASLSLSAHLH